jgi:hypothetical protein
MHRDRTLPDPEIEADIAGQPRFAEAMTHEEPRVAHRLNFVLRNLILQIDKIAPSRSD